MKKRYTFSIEDPMVMEFLEHLDRRKGKVITEIINEHLRLNNGFISKDVCIKASYHYDKWDEVFSSSYFEEEKPLPKVRVPEKKRPSEKREAEHKPDVDMELVMSGLSAFMG